LFVILLLDLLQSMQIQRGEQQQESNKEILNSLSSFQKTRFSFKISLNVFRAQN